MNKFNKADLFKRQTLKFIFEHMFHIHFSTYPICQEAFESGTKTMMAGSCWLPARSFLINIIFCPSRIHRAWMHLSECGIRAKSFWPQKTNNRTLFLAGCVQRQRRHI